MMCRNAFWMDAWSIPDNTSVLRFTATTTTHQNVRHVAPTNDEHGAAHAFEKLVLGL